MFLAAGLSADNDLSIRGTVALLAEEPGGGALCLGVSLVRSLWSRHLVGGMTVIHKLRECRGDLTRWCPVPLQTGEDCLE